MTGSRRGVILVEAVVALAVLLVLAGLIAPAIRAKRMRAHALRVVAVAKQVGAAIATFQQARHAWPTSAGAGLTPAGLASYTAGTPFQSDDYVLRYVLRDVTTSDGDLHHSILIVSPTDPAACPEVYDGLGGAQNPRLIAYCGNDQGSLYLFLN